MGDDLDTDGLRSDECCIYSMSCFGSLISNILIFLLASVLHVWQYSLYVVYFYL